MPDSVADPARLMASPMTRHLKHLVRAIDRFPQIRWEDAVSDGQIGSKLWLAETLARLDRPLGAVLVAGGWVGLLPLILLGQMPDRCTRVVAMDLDDTACRAADILLRHHVMADLTAFAAQGDATALTYDPVSVFERVREDGSRQQVRLRCDTIVNTSWEHFDDPAAWFAAIPAGRLVCIQASNDPALNDHRACPPDLDALCALTPMRQRLVAAALPHAGGQRLMTIGVV